MASIQNASVLELLLSDIIKDAPWVGELIRANEAEPRRKQPQPKRKLKTAAVLASYQINPPNGFPATQWGIGGLQMPTEAVKKKRKNRRLGQRFWYGLNHSVANEFGGFEQEFVVFGSVEEKPEQKIDKLREQLIIESCRKLFQEFAGEGGHFITIDGRPVFISDGSARSAVKLQHGQTTKEAFYKDGKWDESRAKIHEDTAEGYIQGKHPVEGRKPIAHILGGGTASGKTTASRKVLGDDPNVVRVDPDELKLAVPEYESLKESDPANAALRVHDESKEITQKLMAKAIANRMDLTYDATTSGKAGPAMIDTLLKNGYDVRVNFVDIPVNEAVRRAAKRAAESTDPINRGRVVPENIIKDTHSESAQRFMQIKNKPGITSAKLYDNTGQTPMLVYERNNHPNSNALGDELIHDSNRWNQYLRKSRGEKE